MSTATDRGAGAPLPPRSPGAPATRQAEITAFVAGVHKVLRAIRLYPTDNTVVKAALLELGAGLDRVLAADGKCELRYAGDYLFVNEARLRLQLDNYAAIANIVGRMRLAGVGGLIVERRPEPAAWTVLITTLLQPPSSISKAERVEQMTASLLAAGVSHFTLTVAGDDDDGEIRVDDDMERARQTFMQSLSATRDLLTGARMGRSPALRQAKRAVQGIVDSIMSDPTSLVGLTTLRDFDEYTFVHSVNVCILSVALGRRIGLDKLQLLDLGLAALMHDIGKSRVPREVLNKRGSLDADEFRVLQAHTWRGLLALFALQGNAARAWRAMTAAYEHHMRVDFTGYPTPIRPRQLSLFSKIIAVVDGFDAATSVRVYQPNPWSPADVVRGMRDNPKLGLDPLLVRAFINLTGIYPVGTVVGLDTLEIGIVHAASADAQALARPRVRLVFDARGNPLADAPVVDLTDCGSDGGFLRTIVRTENPDRLGIRVSDYFA